MVTRAGLVVAEEQVWQDGGCGEEQDSDRDRGDSDDREDDDKYPLRT